MTRFWNTCLLLLVPTVVGAQAAIPAPLRTNPDAADSATTARSSYRSARESLARGDTTAAMDNLAAAVQAWPQQPAYANALLLLSASAHDVKHATAALSSANAIGFPLPASADTTIAFLWNAPALTQLMTQQQSLRTPIEHSRPLRWLRDSSFFPEGLGADARTGSLYVTSLHQRNILVVNRDGSEHLLLDSLQLNIGGIYGVAVDTARNIIWASTADAPFVTRPSVHDTALAALLVVRLSDGKLLRRFPLGAHAPNASPGDVALSPNGDVFVSDSQAGVLWWLRSGADSLVAVRHHLFRSLQGIVPAADGRVVWVADYAHGLLRVELSTGTVQRVADAAGQTTVGMDGLVRFGNTFVGVQNAFAPAQVVQLTLDSTGTRVVQHTVVDRNSAAISPTGGIVVGNSFVYVANSLWDLVDASGKIPGGTRLRRPLLLSLPLQPSKVMK